jgi:hypothetical protein
MICKWENLMANTWINIIYLSYLKSSFDLEFRVNAHYTHPKQVDENPFS